MRNSSAGNQEIHATEPTPGGWSLRLGRVLGIPIRIHFTFPLLLVFYAFDAATRDGNVPLTVLAVLLMFACVVLHELGHAVMARAYGVGTREIVLYPIGGVARLERIPTGIAELLIALAGPAVNLVLAPLMLVALVLLTDPGIPEATGAITTFSNVLVHVFVANALLFAFNLIPAFPMDGGRVLRALLSLAMPDDRATTIAATIGQAIAVVIGGIGLVKGPLFLLLIALFVFLGAGQEAAFFRRRAVVLGRVAREAMVVEFETLAPQDSLGHAAERLLATHQQDFPVVDAWRRVAGVLTRATLLRGLARQGNEAAVLDVMERAFPTVEPGVDLTEVLRLLQTNPGVPVLVLDDEGLRGMITLENLAEFIEVARHARPAGAPAS